MKRFVIEHERQYFRIETDINGVSQYFKENYDIKIPDDMLYALSNSVLYPEIGLTLKVRGYVVYKTMCV